MSAGLREMCKRLSFLVLASRPLVSGQRAQANRVINHVGYRNGPTLRSKLEAGTMPS
jgi:hypothetical protein